MATAAPRRQLRRQQSKEVWNSDLQGFFSCVRRGKVSEVDNYVKKYGIDVNVRDQWDNCPLYLASLCGHVQMVRYLLKAGAKYDAENVEGQRCFLSALTMDIRAALKENQTACHVASRPVDSPGVPDFTRFLQCMYERTPDFDVELVVADQTFLGHKCILCVRCDYFHQRLTAPDTLQLKTLELTDTVFTPGSMRAILQFLYTGALDLPIEDVKDTQTLAAFLGFITLANCIEAEMKQTVSETSAEDLPEQVINVQYRMLSLDLVYDLRKLVMSAVPQQLHNLVGGTEDPTAGASKAEMANTVTNTPIFPDICFCVGDQQFECHKMFFYGRSEYFRIMLIEKTDDQPPTLEGYRPVVKLDDITTEDFVQVISYLYQDQCLVDATNRSSLLDVCDRWTLPHLKLQLLNEGEGVTVSNVMQTYLATKQGNNELLEQCYQCMAENLMELAPKYEFQEFLKRELPAPGKEKQMVNTSLISRLLYHIRITARTWHDQRCANEKIKKLNYIISNRLGHQANFTQFDIPPVPPESISTRPVPPKNKRSTAPVPPESVRSTAPVPPESTESSNDTNHGKSSSCVIS